MASTSKESKSMKNKRIGKKMIQAELRKCVFDPNKPGPLAIMFDIHRNDYYPERAREYIWEAQQEGISEDIFQDRLEKAIQHLVWAKLRRQQSCQGKN